METIIVSKDSKLMQMIRNAKARKQAWQDSIRDEMNEMQRELWENNRNLKLQN